MNVDQLGRGSPGLRSVEDEQVMSASHPWYRNLAAVRAEPADRQASARIRSARMPKACACPPGLQGGEPASSCVQRLEDGHAAPRATALERYCAQGPRRPQGVCTGPARQILKNSRREEGLPDAHPSAYPRKDAASHRRPRRRCHASTCPAQDWRAAHLQHQCRGSQIASPAGLALRDDGDPTPGILSTSPGAHKGERPGSATPPSGPLTACLPREPAISRPRAPAPREARPRGVSTALGARARSRPQGRAPRHAWQGACASSM